MEWLGKLGTWIIAIVVLVLLLVFYYSEGGAWEKVKSLTTSMGRFLPNASLGAEELEAGEPYLSEVRRREILALREAITKLSRSPEKDCFVKYGGFTPLEDTRLEISYDTREDKTFFIIYSRGGKQVVTEANFELESVQPCVIAGNKEVTKNFEKKFFLRKEGLGSNYFTPVQKIIIAYNPEGLNENRINHGSGFKDFEGHRWLFTPDNKHFCFFPTRDSWTGADGVDDDYFTSVKDEDYMFPLC